MNVSPMQSSDNELSFPQRYVQERAERYNEQVMQLFLAETDWSLFDVFSVNRPVLYASPPLYQDPYHFPGLLTQIGWHIIAPMLCPEMLPPLPTSTPPAPLPAAPPAEAPPAALPQAGPRPNLTDALAAAENGTGGLR